MKRQTYLAIPYEKTMDVSSFSLKRIIRGHITLIDDLSSTAENQDGWSSSVFARFSREDSELVLQLVFVHFVLAPIEIELHTFDLFEGNLIGRFRFVGSSNKEVPDLVDQLAILE